MATHSRLKSSMMLRVIVDQDSEARSTVLPLIWCPPHRDQLHLRCSGQPMSEPSLRSSFRRRYWEEELLLYTTCLNDCGLFLIERYQLRAVDLEESSSRESRRIKRIGWRSTTPGRIAVAP